MSNDLVPIPSRQLGRGGLDKLPATIARVSAAAAFWCPHLLELLWSGRDDSNSRPHRCPSQWIVTAAFGVFPVSGYWKENIARKLSTAVFEADGKVLVNY
jgi:hypothetical protein